MGRVVAQAMAALLGVGVVTAGCTTTPAAQAASERPHVPAARLTGMTAEQRAGYDAAEAALAGERELMATTRSDLKGVELQLVEARSRRDAARAELAQARELADAGREAAAPGHEERAALTADVPGAERMEQASDQRVAYLESLKSYAEQRHKVAERRVSAAQARADHEAMQALQRYRPGELRRLDDDPLEVARRVGEREHEVEEQRDAMEEALDQAHRHYADWENAWRAVGPASPADRPINVPPPDDLPPL